MYVCTLRVSEPDVRGSKILQCEEDSEGKSERCVGADVQTDIACAIRQNERRDKKRDDR